MKSKCKSCGHSPCECKPYPNEKMHEHQTIISRTTGRKREISMGMNGQGLVPSNPFASLAQAGYMHEHPEILGNSALKEWDKASKGRKIPYKVKGK
jgi:hypothetical protein